MLAEDYGQTCIFDVPWTADRFQDCGSEDFLPTLLLDSLINQGQAGLSLLRRTVNASKRFSSVIWPSYNVAAGHGYTAGSFGYIAESYRRPTQPVQDFPPLCPQMGELSQWQRWLWELDQISLFRRILSVSPRFPWHLPHRGCSARQTQKTPECSKCVHSIRII